MKTLLLPFALVLAAAPLAADEVRLRNGGRLEGVVREQGNSVVVVLDSGTVTLPKSDVASIQRASLPLHEFETREQKAQDTAARLELARWAEAHGLPGRARDLYRRILDNDPQNRDARQALGYTYRDGRWLDADELKAAQGMVRVEGRWVTPEERDKLRERELELRRAQVELEMQEEKLARDREAEAARRTAERNQAQYLQQTLPGTQGTSWVPVPWGTMPWSPYRYPFTTGYPYGASQSLRPAEAGAGLPGPGPSGP